MQYTSSEREKFTEEELNYKAERRIDSDIEIEQETGITGMALTLIDFLTTLLTKGSIRPIIQAGLVPLITTIISYMILPSSHFSELKDKSEFAGDKDVYDHTVRNYCKELIN